MMHQNIGLLALFGGPEADELIRVASAIDHQINRDVAKAWGVNASVHAYPTRAHAPASMWPVYIQPKIDDPDAEGYHTDLNNQPYARVVFDDQWTKTVSHEVIEMLVDPWGSRLVEMELDFGSLYRGDAKVLVEACDPCEDSSYQIYGVTVSDFTLPEYYGVTGASQRATFLDRLMAGQIGRNGYISFIDLKTERWKQISQFGSKEIADLGPGDANHFINVSSHAGTMRQICDCNARAARRKVFA